MQPESEVPFPCSHGIDDTHLLRFVLKLLCFLPAFLVGKDCHFRVCVMASNVVPGRYQMPSKYVLNEGQRSKNCTVLSPPGEKSCPAGTLPPLNAEDRTSRVGFW